MVFNEVLSTGALLIPNLESQSPIFFVIFPFCCALWSKTTTLIGGFRMKRGFTLIELLIVVAIIGILATIAVPNFVNTWNRAKVSRAKADLKALATALDMYCIDHGNYPYVQDKGIEWQMPTGFPANHDKGPAGLTSPTPYLSHGLPDPFLLELGTEGNDGNYLLYYERCGFGFRANGEHHRTCRG